MIRAASNLNKLFFNVEDCRSASFIYPLIAFCLILAVLLPIHSLASPSANTQRSATSPSNLVDQDLKEHLKQAITEASSFKDKFEAQVWLIDMSNRLKRYIKNSERRIQFLKVLHQEATKANLPPEAVLAVIQIESAFKQYAISYVGARGYMQVMPFWKKEIGREDDNMMNMETNLRYGCTILAYYLKIEKGNWIRALGRYNGSLGKMKYPEKVLLAWERNWYVENI